jgi:hypothetical protein
MLPCISCLFGHLPFVTILSFNEKRGGELPPPFHKKTLASPNKLIINRFNYLFIDITYVYKY